MKNICKIFCLSLAAAVSATPVALAGEGSGLIMDYVGRLSRTLKDPQLAGQAQAGRRRSKACSEARSIFNFDASITRVMKPEAWQALTPEQKTEFRGLYTDLLGAKLTPMLELYDMEKAELKDELPGEGESSIVTLKTERTSTKEAAEAQFHLRKIDGKLMVYDMTAAGVNFVENVRSDLLRLTNNIAKASDSGARDKAFTDLTGAMRKVVTNMGISCDPPKAANSFAPGSGAKDTTKGT